MTAADQVAGCAPLDLRPIRERAEAATPGPWIAVTDNGRRDGIGIVGQVAKRGSGEAIAVFAGVNGGRHADAIFTAHARVDVVDLLTEVVRLRAVVERVRVEEQSAALDRVAQIIGVGPDDVDDAERITFGEIRAALRLAIDREVTR